MNDLAADNSASIATDNPETEPGVIVSGTSATGGQAQGATPADDLFKGIDPNRLPPEVKAHYDSMLRDYRDKTGKLSETVKSQVAKDTETYKQRADLYDQIANQEEFVKQWNDYVQKVNGQSNNQSSIQGDPQLNAIKQQVQEMNEKIQMAELAQVRDAFADAVNEKGEKIHPDFDKFNEIIVGQLNEGNDAEDFSLLRACIELAPGTNPNEKLANGYKQAKQMYEAIFEEGRKAGMGRLQAKVLNGTQPPTNVGSGLSVTEKKPRNAHEAIEMARKGLVVSR